MDNNSSNQNNKRFFKHLEIANQTYFEHFKDAFGYSCSSFIASFYFLCHAIWPDIFTKAGSDKINYLHNIIMEKYTTRQSELENPNVNIV